MDVRKMVQELRDQRDQLEQAIASLNRLDAGKPRRGRPPKWAGTSGPSATVKADTSRKRRFSKETRKRMSEGQKRRRMAEAS